MILVMLLNITRSSAHLMAAYEHTLSIHDQPHQLRAARWRLESQNVDGAKHQQLRMHAHKEDDMIRGMYGRPNERNVTHYTMLLPKPLNL